jgi:hypothetical protein
VEDLTMGTVTTAPAPEPESQAQIGSMGRISGVLLSPSKTFADIARRPSWVVPFVLLMVLSLGVSILIGQKTDWRGFFERQMSQSSRFDNMSQEQKDRILESQVTWAPRLSFVFGPLAIGIGLLIISAIYMGAFNLFKGAGLGFGQAWGITVYASVPALISSVLAIIILLIKQKGDVDPEHFLATSLAAYLPEGTSKWLEALGQSLELFWIWSLSLIAIGFAAANPKKIKSGSAFGIAFGLWLVWVVCKMGWAFIFS